MRECPKCHSNTLIIDEFMYGGGSTENRQSGDKHCAWERAHKCVICGFYMPEEITPMEIKHSSGRRDNRSAAVFDNFLNENMDRIKRMKKKRLSYLEIAELLSIEFGSTIAPSTLQRRYQESL